MSLCYQTLFFRTKCLGNIHQMYLSIPVYLADHSAVSHASVCPILLSQLNRSGHSCCCCFARNRPPGARGPQPPAPWASPGVTTTGASLPRTFAGGSTDRGPTHASTRSRCPVAVRPPAAGKFCPGPSRGERRLPSSSSPAGGS
jgi:hypothetical protein